MPDRAPTASGRRFLVPASVGIVGLALIGIGQTVPNRHAIQDDLTSRSTEALKAADLNDVSVSFSGRDATVTISGATSAEQAENVVSDVDGVRVVDTTVVLAGGEPAPAPAETPAAPTEPATPTEASTPTEAATAKPAPLPVGFTLVDGTITVTGTVASEPDRKALVDAVASVGNGWKVVDRLSVDDSLTATVPAANRFPAVTELLAQAPIEGTKLVIQYKNDAVILRGSPADAGVELKLLGAAAASVADKNSVVDGLDVAS